MHETTVSNEVRPAGPPTQSQDQTLRHIVTQVNLPSWSRLSYATFTQRFTLTLIMVRKGPAFEKACTACCA